MINSLEQEYGTAHCGTMHCQPAHKFLLLYDFTQLALSWIALAASMASIYLQDRGQYGELL